LTFFSKIQDIIFLHLAYFTYHIQINNYIFSSQLYVVNSHKSPPSVPSSRWMVAGHGDALREGQGYEHPDSPLTGDALATQVLSFEKIKLTNNDVPAAGQVRVYVIKACFLVKICKILIYVFVCLYRPHGVK